MFVRETRVQGPPDRVQEAIQNYEKTILPVVRKTPGNVGAALLVNRQTGAGIGITYWESAKALAASEEMGNQARAQSAKDVPGSSVINVERAEIMIMDRVAPPMKGSMLRVNTLNADPQKLDAAIQHIRNHVLPILNAQKGYRATIAGIDRPSGRLTVATVWDSKADLDASESKVAGPRAEVAKAAGAGSDVQIEIFETALADLTGAVAEVKAKV